MDFAREDTILYTNIGMGQKINDLHEKVGQEKLLHAAKIVRTAGKIIIKVISATWNALKIDVLWDKSGSPPRFVWA